jgi:hypothetical protein
VPRFNLDIWADVKDESLDDAASLPAPEVIAEEIVANLTTAFESFAAVAAELGGNRMTAKPQMVKSASELLSLEGMPVSNAREAGDQLELEVEHVAAAGVCPDLRRGGVDSGGAATRAGARSAPRGPTDLPLLAQAALPLPCLRAELHRVTPRASAPASHPPFPVAPLRAGALRRACRDHPRGTHDALPSRARLPARGIGKANWRVARRSPAAPRLDEAAHRRGSQALAAVVSDPDPGVVEVLDGRSRRTPALAG